jgi:hypothetical protein
MFKIYGVFVTLCAIMVFIIPVLSGSFVWAQGEDRYTSEVKAIAPAAPGDLPAAVDNSTSSAFPPIGDQGAIASCVGWSTTYYQFTYENDKVRGLNASSGDQSVIFSPKWTYNMINGGINGITNLTDAYALLTKNGAASWADFPYSSDSTVVTNFTGWCLNSAAWRNAINFRLADTGIISHSSDSDVDTFISQLKTWLAAGHVIVFPTYAKSWVQTKISSDPSTNGTDPHAGEFIASYMNNTDNDYHERFRLLHQRQPGRQLIAIPGERF